MNKTGPPSAISPPDTPRTSVADTSRSSSTETFRVSTENPFENPQYVQVREDTKSTAASSSSFPPTPKGVTKGNGTAERPVLHMEDTISRSNQPPRPLGLPPPTTPPPASLGTVPQRQELNEEAQKTGKRWWTEWLCGCREDEGDQVYTNLSIPSVLLKDLFRRQDIQTRWNDRLNGQGGLRKIFNTLIYMLWTDSFIAFHQIYHPAYI